MIGSGTIAGMSMSLLLYLMVYLGIPIMGGNNDGYNVNIRKVITNENNQKNNKTNINYFC